MSASDSNRRQGVLIANSANQNVVDGKKARDESVRHLMELETRRAKHYNSIRESEKEADDAYSSLSNHISFLVDFNGGAFLLQHISSGISCYKILTSIFMIPLISGLVVVIYVANTKLSRIAPARFSLITKMNILVCEARDLLNLETGRIAGSIHDDNVTLLHHLVEANSVVRDCRTIMNSKKLSTIDENYNYLIIHAIIVGIIHVAVVFLVLYFTFWVKMDELTEWLWPMIQSNLLLQAI